MAEELKLNNMIGCDARMDSQQAVADGETGAPQPMRYRDLPNLIDTETAARALNVNVRTVTRMCAAGKLKAVRVMSLWRINRDALLEFAGIDPDAVVPGAALN